MPSYKIKLTSLDDFRKYSNMITRFHIAGYLETDQERINMYDILDLIQQGPLSCATMLLTTFRKDELPALEAYMKDENLSSEAPLPQTA